MVKWNVDYRSYGRIWEPGFGTNVMGIYEGSNNMMLAIGSCIPAALSNSIVGTLNPGHKNEDFRNDRTVLKTRIGNRL